METSEGKLEKMPMPKVRFELPTAETETDLIFHFCHGRSSGGWDWSEKVYKRHPKLKEMVQGIDDEKEFYEKCREYVEGYLAENREAIEAARDDFQKAWEETEGRFYDEITRDFDVDFPEDIKEIKANVSINPICPRHLDKWSFNVFYKSPIDNMKKTCVHEMIHFFHFKKWLEVFPGYDKKTFNGPHSEWKLSEIVVSPIINNNKTFQEIVNGRQDEGYSEFKDIKIDGQTLIEYFGAFYREHLEGKMSFADFLKKSWEEYQNHRDIIEGEIKS